MLSQNTPMGHLQPPTKSIFIRKVYRNFNIVGTVRGRGRKPDGLCITAIFTEGNVMLRRGIFRKLKAIILEKISELCYMAANNINGFDSSYLEIFNEF
jgi:hypothetical protein